MNDQDYRFVVQYADVKVRCRTSADAHELIQRLQPRTTLARSLSERSLAMRALRFLALHTSTVTVEEMQQHLGLTSATSLGGIAKEVRRRLAPHGFAIEDVVVRTRYGKTSRTTRWQPGPRINEALALLSVSTTGPEGNTVPHDAAAVRNAEHTPT